MIWSILLLLKNDNGWFINYIEKKLKEQITKSNLNGKIEVIVFKPNVKFSGEYVNVIENDSDISDNYIDVIYNKIINTKADCIGLKGLLFVDDVPYIFNNIEIYKEQKISITKSNPIKKEIIFKLKNIAYYISSENLSKYVNSIDNVNKIVSFKKVRTKKEPISIIITAYKSEKYIKECLDSIEKQTYFNDNYDYEILIGVDGCQTTLDRIDKIKHKYRNLSVYMMESNKGTYITTNTLIGLVKNENVIRFDSDDVMVTTLVEDVFKNKKDNDILMLGSLELQNGTIFNKFLMTDGIIYFKKSFMDNVAGGYMPWVCSADTELIRRVVNKAKISQLKKALFYRRIHSDSLTQNKITAYKSNVRENYKKQIKLKYKPNEIKIDRVTNKIKSNINKININLENKKEYNLLFMISTYNRLGFLKKTINTWFNTHDKKHNWSLIVSDDGSTDGTIEYLENLNLDNVKIFILKNDRRGIHHQTNSMFKLALKIDFDYGFKCDDDLIFKTENWDNLYLNASLLTGYEHLIFYDKEWGDRRKEKINSTIKDSIIENCVKPTNLQGAFWTFTKNIINKVGFFDTNIYNLCGLGHVDYSLRCCRMGFNNINTPFDIIDSNNYISLNKENYVSHNNFRYIWNTKEIIQKKKDNLLNDRNYIPYNEPNKNLLNENVDKYDISFIIPIRGRIDQVVGLEFNLEKYFYNYKYELIYIHQDDEKLFKRGQLCNIGFKESKGDIVVFQDIDIRHLREIDFKKILNNLQSPFVAFDRITQLNENKIGEYDIIETEFRLKGWGACSVFFREDFIISNGFSNLVFGWGAEDNILNERSNFKRYLQDLGHVFHEQMRKNVNLYNEEWYLNNKKILYSDNNRIKNKDGYIQTKCNINNIKMNNNIKNLYISDIYINDNYKYDILYNDCLDIEKFSMNDDNIKKPISIIVTAYQSQKFIHECLDSIEYQRYFINNDNFEVLVGVDGCEDTLNRLLKIRKKYRNLRIFMMSENKGTYITSNTLIDLTKYENIIRFDSDDIMNLDMIKKIAIYINDYSMIKFGYDNFIGNKSNIVKHENENYYFPHGVLLYKKFLFDTFGGYKDWLCAADSELLARIGESVKIKEIYESLFYRRQHENSLTKNEKTKRGSNLRNEYSKLIGKHESSWIDKKINNYNEY